MYLIKFEDQDDGKDRAERESFMVEETPSAVLSAINAYAKEQNCKIEELGDSHARLLYQGLELRYVAVWRQVSFGEHIFF